jgi:diaminohydroxyphosphoribosylaminopyrimidine deaminase/5-amino-6-(5-phosphoribosylamino)uracil reductase
VIIDTTLKTPLASRIVAGAGMVPVVIVTTPEASPEREAALREKGVRVERVGFGPDGQGVDLGAAMEALGRIGFTRVLCEGGPRLAEALAIAGLVDSVIVLTGPDHLAGGGLVALGPHLRGVMDESRNRYAVEHVAAGADMIEIYGGRS